MPFKDILKRRGWVSPEDRLLLEQQAAKQAETQRRQIEAQKQAQYLQEKPAIESLRKKAKQTLESSHRYHFISAAAQDVSLHEALQFIWSQWAPTSKNHSVAYNPDINSLLDYFSVQIIGNKSLCNHNHGGFGFTNIPPEIPAKSLTNSPAASSPHTPFSPQ